MPFTSYKKRHANGRLLGERFHFPLTSLPPPSLGPNLNAPFKFRPFRVEKRPVFCIQKVFHECTKCVASAVCWYLILGNFKSRRAWTSHLRSFAGLRQMPGLNKILVALNQLVHKTSRNEHNVAKNTHYLETSVLTFYKWRIQCRRWLNLL